MWVIAAILLVALMIPITAILVDSPLGRSMARRLEGPPSVSGGPDVKALERRVELLETELEDLSRSLAGMHDELQFVHRLLEDPKKKQP